MERTNQPLTNEAARKLMALDVQDKEISSVTLSKPSKAGA